MTASFIIEGTWNGRVVHRSVHPASSEILRKWAEKTQAVYYQVGDPLCLSVRDCGPDEMVDETANLNDSYSRLIADCARYDVDSVDALIAAERLA